MTDGEKRTGLLVKAISGFYYVLCDNENVIYECKAKGVFRNEAQAPLVGDHVELEVSEERRGTVSKIMERKNEFTRPPLANLDKLFLVCSMLEPSPSTLVIDKLITVCEYKDIEPIIVVTKIDLKEEKEFKEIYEKAGFTVICLSNLEGKTDEAELLKVKECLKGSVCAFAGNTGVGKSSLLNNICPALNLETSHISKKLNRGRHTTRQVELFYLDETNGYVADTPGFGSMEMLKYEVILKDKLELCFREFLPFIDKCKFTGCSHTVEKGCAVLEAVKNGIIPVSRHESYCTLYHDAGQIKTWEIQ